LNRVGGKADAVLIVNYFFAICRANTKNETIGISFLGHSHQDLQNRSRDKMQAAHLVP